MNTLIQTDDNVSEGELPPDTALRSLRLFSIHKCIFDKKIESFIHFLVVYGYSGGGCQDECFYKLSGSDLEKSIVHISTSAGDLFYQYIFENQNRTEIEVELSKFDRQIQLEFIEETNKHLVHDDAADFYFYDNRNSDNKGVFLISDKFPLRIIKFLQGVYWPFSTHW